MRLAARAKLLSPSPTLAITAKAKALKAQGKPVISFGAGEPDFDTPDFVKQAGIEAINSGFTRYTPTSGIPELKQAIAEKLKRENNLYYLPEQIIVSCGAKHSLFNAILALCEPGDEVLIPAPYWVSYPEMVYISGAQPVFIPTTAATAFKVTEKQLLSAINRKTKLIIINSPANPTGSVYSRDELQMIADIAVKNSIFVISDEIYEQLVYDQTPYYSLAGINPRIYDFTITVNGLSKSSAMTGWRIGYAAANKEIIAVMGKLQDHSTSNPCSISQKAALAAIKGGKEFIAKMKDAFVKRRDFMVGRVSQMKKISAYKPSGAFYLYCDISATGLKAEIFAERLLEEKFVAVVAGEGFGDSGHIRLSFATSLEDIKQGLDRIEEFISNLK